MTLGENTKLTLSHPNPNPVSFTPWDTSVLKSLPQGHRAPGWLHWKMSTGPGFIATRPHELFLPILQQADGATGSYMGGHLHEPGTMLST